jgi:hypothetical protein
VEILFAVELFKNGIYGDVRYSDYIEFVRGIKTLLKCLNKLYYYYYSEFRLLRFDKIPESFVKSVNTISSKKLDSLLYKFVASSIRTP